MNASRTRQPPPTSESVPQQVPQIEPTAAYGQPSHDFTLQAIMELQKSVGEMNANMTATRGSVDSMRGKLDDLIGWKNKIIGGAAVLGAVFTLLGILLAKASDYVTLKGATAAPPVVAPVNPAPPSQSKP